jgi:hypothetical protein
MALFLVWHDEDRAIVPEPGLALDRFELRPGLLLVDSDLQLWPLYHEVDGRFRPARPCSSRRAPICPGSS